MQYGLVWQVRHGCLGLDLIGEAGVEGDAKWGVVKLSSVLRVLFLFKRLKGKPGRFFIKHLKVEKLCQTF